MDGWQAAEVIYARSKAMERSKYMHFNAFKHALHAVAEDRFDDYSAIVDQVPHPPTPSTFNLTGGYTRWTGGYTRWVYRWVYKVGIQDGYIRWVYKVGIQGGYIRWVYKVDRWVCKVDRWVYKVDRWVYKV
jgi:hypothetical protein